MQTEAYEREHSEFIRRHGAECTVLLKSDGSFPLKKPCRIALYGSGARHTVKGGTGSGEVNSRYSVSIEEGLKEAGFTVTTGDWMDGYDKAKAEAKVAFMKAMKAEAKQRRQNVMLISMGRTPAEPEYELPLNGGGDTAVYVLSRISGEGADRSPAGGDILLSQTEIRDILRCCERYQRFLLVLNVGGPVDLSPVDKVKNVLLLSQLGAETGHILADILLGKQNPSGKLSTTWSAWEDYPAMGDFGEKDDTRYKEGIYVGYRYFDSAGIRPAFPFGFGLSYTRFALGEAAASLCGDRVTVTVPVKNTGARAGREVVQLYASIPAGKLDEPYQVLAGFQKTGLLECGQEEQLALSFSLRDIAPYDPETASYILEAGDYLLRVGTSSRDTAVCAAVRIPETLTVLHAKNVLGRPDFEDWKAPASQTPTPEGVPILTLEADAIPTEAVNYSREETVDPRVEALSDEQLIKMNLGAYDPKGGVASIIGSAGFTVAGAAGQSCMEIPDVPSLVMADGPAGLRLSRRYAVDKVGKTHPLESSFPASITDFMPKPFLWALKLMTYRPKKTDRLGEQYATAIPIGTAVAQSFDPELAERFGAIVGEEMERFGVHLWLAPALNIHRSIRCGRNFEYFSEDPLVSGIFAGAITKGVQRYPHAGTTIKHYAFNNQERNRTQNNSQLSERAAREIYLKGFGIAVKTAQPKAVMTSYNLVNGRHTNERRDLIEDVLRAEFGFEGIVMTDWIVAGYENELDCVYPVSDASHVCMAGGDLFMPGSAHDFELVKAGLAGGAVTRRQLQINATRVLDMAERLCGKTK
ncbi:MAG: glycoside hydrolase family 3 C-terminal domain-containing protein [Oscillospiraceae bacterium]|nr:glycoside hydrolase family 3 C-terminal domain-containing protein [Oscillospiraceae bacterium]